MQIYRHDPSISTAVSRDADTVTQASQKPSTAPTSILPPQQPIWETVQQSLPSSNTLPVLSNRDDRRGRMLRSSATWTSSTADLAMFPDSDEIQDRRSFVLEYNRLAKKHGIRVLVVEDFEGRPATPAVMSEKRRWWSRMFRSPSSGQPSSPRRSSDSVRHKRSVSDIAHHLIASRRSEPKTVDLQTMVRLSGKSFLYLPEDYAPGSLMLPTCFRAVAQYLVQYGPETRGIFRIPGSLRVVNGLFDYYCHEKAGEQVTSTIRCPSLPAHIKFGAHDVASAFKKFLSVLPGGILGSLSLLDAFVAIHSQLRGDPELNRTMQTKLRARLIALAIGTVKSQFHRELICAVFGLLSIIGRSAEMAAREDERGHPLPTSDLMGYNALGIVFGPLLVGELLDSYTMKLASPSSGLLLFPLTPPKLRRERQVKAQILEDATPLGMDKIRVANDIAEMVITNWREVVRNMKSLNVLTRINQVTERISRRTFLRSSRSDPFTIGLPKGWKSKQPSSGGSVVDRESSPTSDTPTPANRVGCLDKSKTSASLGDKLDVKRSRPRISRSASSNRLSLGHSLNPLSPTVEEDLVNNRGLSFRRPDSKQSHVQATMTKATLAKLKCSAAAKPLSQEAPLEAAIILPTSSSKPQEMLRKSFNAASPRSLNRLRTVDEPRGSNVSGRNSHSTDSSRVSEELVPVKASSKSAPQMPAQVPNSSDRPSTGEYQNGKPLHQSKRSSAQSSEDTKNRNTGLVSAALRRLIGTDRSEMSSSGSPIARTLKHGNSSPDDLSPLTVIRLSPEVRSPQGEISSKPRTFITNSVLPSAQTQPEDGCRKTAWKGDSVDDSKNLDIRTSSIDVAQSSCTRTPRRSKDASEESDCNSSIQITPKEYRAEMNSPARSRPINRIPTKTQQEKLPSRFFGSKDDSQTSLNKDPDSASQSGTTVGNPLPFSNYPIILQTQDALSTRRLSPKSLASRAEEVAQSSRNSSLRHITPIRSSGGTLNSLKSSRGTTSKPNGVKAMAAMFEVASKDSPFIPSPMGNRPSRTGETLMTASQPRFDTPSPKSLKPARSYWSIAKASDERQSRTSSTSVQTTETYQSARSPAGNVLQQDKPVFGPLRQTPDLQMYRKTPTRAPTFNEEKNLPNLGTMVSHPEQPPIAQHVSFPRPPSSTSLGHFGESPGSWRPGSPGGNSGLYAQIRSLQRRLEAKVEEAASLRRQLKTRDDMDVGVLSEQLRSVKRECVMWRGRAEAAEKRVAALERFTGKLRGIKVGDAQGDAQNDYNGRSSRLRGSTKTTWTEDAGVVSSRIRMGLVGIEGAKSSDGGAAAWWNERRTRPYQRFIGKPQQHCQASLAEEHLLELVEAVQELLTDEGFE